jgi:hypothetical protein
MFSRPTGQRKAAKLCLDALKATANEQRLDGGSREPSDAESIGTSSQGSQDSLDKNDKYDSEDSFIASEDDTEQSSSSTGESSDDDESSYVASPGESSDEDDEKETPGSGADC